MSDNFTDRNMAAVSAAIRHIGTGIYSSGRIRDYLMNKGFSYTESVVAVNELISRGYIDDIRAGCKVLYSRSGRKQESRAMLSKRLAAAGVDEATAMSLIDSLDDDFTLCISLINSYCEPEKDDPATFEECMKLCKRRGFSFEISARAYSKIINGIIY